MHSQISMPRAIALIMALAFARTVTAQDAKAAEVLAGARKAIGGKKLDTLSSLSVQATAQRNVGNFQMTSNLELLLGLPDKYVRSESSNSAMVSMSNTMGFNGERPIKSAAQAGMPAGGGMMIRMGGPGVAMGSSGEKPTPEQQAQLDKQLVGSARQEISRLMLGWFATAHPSVTVQYSYAGEAESPDGKAFIIDAKSADGFAARLFIDETTHLPLMVTYQAPQARMVTAGGPPPGGGGGRAEGPARQASAEDRQRIEADAQRQIQQLDAQPPAMVEYSLYFDDWRDVDGIKFPHALRRGSAGTTMEEWTVTKVKVNPRIDPKKFDSEQ
jgi:hypothetical protein